MKNSCQIWKEWHKLKNSFAQTSYPVGHHSSSSFLAKNVKTILIKLLDVKNNIFRLIIMVRSRMRSKQKETEIQLCSLFLFFIPLLCIDTLLRIGWIYYSLFLFSIPVPVLYSFSLYNDPYPAEIILQQIIICQSQRPKAKKQVLRYGSNQNDSHSH